MRWWLSICRGCEFRLWLKKRNAEFLGCLPERLVSCREGKAPAFGKLQIRSIVCAALVQPRLVENGAKHLIDPLKVYGDGELLQVAKEYRALRRRNLFPAFRHHESIYDFEFPDSRHDYSRAANDGLKHGVRVGSTLVLKTPCNCYGVVEDEGAQNRRPSSTRSRMVKSGPRTLPLRRSRMLRPASSRA